MTKIFLITNQILIYIEVLKTQLIKKRNLLAHIAQEFCLNFYVINSLLYIISFYILFNMRSFFFFTDRD